MSTQTFPRRTPALDSGLLREAAAVVLIVMGVAGLVILAFLVSPKVGAAALCVLSIAAGFALGYERGPRSR